MIQEFVDRFMKNKDELREYFRIKKPNNYSDIVKMVVKLISPKDWRCELDYENIYEIDDGDYQGTLVYIIHEKCYQPYTYYAVKVSYGSCSGCDTLKSIISNYEYGDVVSREEECLKDYMSLALHIVQGIEEI